MSHSTSQSTNNGVRSRGLAYRGDTLPRNLNDSSNVAFKSDIDSVSVTINNDHQLPIKVDGKSNIINTTATNEYNQLKSDAVAKSIAISNARKSKVTRQQLLDEAIGHFKNKNKLTPVLNTDTQTTNFKQIPAISANIKTLSIEESVDKLINLTYTIYNNITKQTIVCTYIDKLGKYIKSYYSPINVFVNGSLHHNFKFEDSVKNEVLRTKITSSKFQKFTEGKEHSTLRELYYFLLTTPDDAPTGKNHGFAHILYHLFNTNDDTVLLPEYSLIKADAKYSLLYKLIEPRYETSVITYVVNYIKSIPFFNDEYIKTQYHIETQVEFENKFYDFGIYMLNNGFKFLLEVHEDSSAHNNNENDLTKKMIAIRNKNIIIYFRENDYNNGKRVEALKQLRNDLYDNISALIIDQNITCRRTFLKYAYKDEIKKEGIYFADLLKNTSNDTEKTNLINICRNAQYKLSENGMKDLFKIFEWKELSQNQNDGSVIKLNDVLGLIDAEQSTINNIMQNSDYKPYMKHINNEYMINWKIMAKIVNKYCKDKLQDQLISYLLSVEGSYELMRNFSTKYNKLKEDLTNQFFKYEMEKRLYLPNKQIKELTYTNVIIESTNELYKYNINKFVDSSIKFKNMFDDLKHNIKLTKPHKKVIADYESILSETTKLDDHIRNKFYHQKVDEYTYNVINNGQPIFGNRSDIKIYWNKDSCKIIKHADFIALCNSLDVQPTVSSQFVKIILGDNIDLTSNPDIGCLDIKYDGVPLVNNIMKIEKLENDKNNEIDFEHLDFSNYEINNIKDESEESASESDYDSE